MTAHVVVQNVSKRPRFKRYCVADHNPPVLADMLDFCENVRDFFNNSHNMRVAVAVHCKGGKGRTGTMICAYLLFSGVKMSAEAAMAFYRDRRTSRACGPWVSCCRGVVSSFFYVFSGTDALRSVSWL